MPINGKTLLHLVCQMPLPPVDPPRVVGIDDWAWRRGHRYGTILCDLERHQLIELVPDRSAETVAAWLRGQRQIEIITRDRGGLYADGASRGAPGAIQVADRWHLVDNLVDALERFLLHKRSLLKETAAGIEPIATGCMVQSPGACIPTDEMYPGRRKHPIPCAWHERAEEESQRRHAARLACYKRIHAFAAAGADKADIARMVGVSRQTVYRYLMLSSPPERRQPKRFGTVLDPWKPYLLRRWAEGCHNGMRLWREIREQGFAYSCTNVARFVAQIRRGETARPPPRGKHVDVMTSGTELFPSAGTRPLAPEWSARRVASLMVYRPERLSEVQERYLVALRKAEEAIREAYRLAQDFLVMVRERTGDHLDTWIAAAQESDVAELRRYASGSVVMRIAIKSMAWDTGVAVFIAHHLRRCN